MFKPTSAMKKILGTYGNYAYIHNDGVIVVEKRQVKVTKEESTDIQVWHVIPCDIQIRVVDYSKTYTWSDAPKVACLVVHSGSTIANGFDSVKVCFNNGKIRTSEGEKALNNVYFTLGYQTWNTTELEDNFGGDISIQPNPYYKYSPSYADCSKSIRSSMQFQYRQGYSVVIHGDLPEEKKEEEEQKQLTVLEGNYSLN